MNKKKKKEIQIQKVREKIRNRRIEFKTKIIYRGGG